MKSNFLQVRVLWSNKTNNGTEYRSTKIISVYDKVYKLSYSNRNGVSDLDIHIMNGEGIFVFNLSKYDIGHEFVSYVCDESDKDKNCDVAFKKCEEVISKIYN
jgi:hypothetical protein